MMKRMIVMLMLLSVAVLGLGMRAEVASAEKDEVRTVAQAKKLKDGTNVTLIGYIVKYIGLFSRYYDYVPGIDTPKAARIFRCLGPISV